MVFFNHSHAHTPPKQGDTASCQMARQYKKSPVDIVLNKLDYDVSVNASNGFSKYEEGAFGTLRHSGGDLGGGSESLVVVPHYIVRRLTPTECERLQGFPDDWTKYGADSEKQIADSPRYQMLGNSLPIPCARFILHNIAAMNIAAMSKTTMSKESKNNDRWDGHET
jgi:site-specific DNA-cytosine methylase